MLSTGQHTLTTQPDSDEPYKHCILVKLTDSSARAIEEFLKNKNNINRKPTIQFQKDRGEILLPIDSSKSANSNPNESHYKKFYFALSSVKESNKEGSASFECISYDNSKLATVGTVEQKLTVQANDEVFQATKEKVNSVVEEEKKNSTIEIKPSGSIVNRNSAMKHPKPVKTPVAPSAPFASTSTTQSSSLNTDLPKSKHHTAERPLRERIIHLLALKPYIKAELMIKLSKDGPLSDREKESLDSILHSVGTLNSKTSSYELTSETMLNEVKEDWPFYNDAQRTAVKRNIMRVKQMPATTTTSQNSSSTPAKPISTLSSSTSSSSLNTKPASSAFVSIAQNKTKTTTDSFYPSSLAKRTSPVKPTSATLTNVTPKSLPKTTKIEQLFGSPDSDDLLDDSLDSLKKSNEKEIQPSKKIKKSFDSEEKEMDNLNKIYKKIQTRQQYDQYKSDFDLVYNEYVELHNYVESTAKLFARLKSEIESINDKNSKEFEIKESKIIKEYNEKLMNDFVKKKEKYDYLYAKLTLLKTLTSQYEQEDS